MAMFRVNSLAIILACSFFKIAIVRSFLTLGHYFQILFVVTAILMIVISLLTKAPAPETIKYTFYGATDEEKKATRESWNTMDVVLSLGVVAVCVIFYIVFF